MRSIYILSILFLTSLAMQAEEVSGKMTLERDVVVFRADSVEEKYDAMKIPGLKALKFEKRTATKGDQEIDVSALVLQTSTGENITLVMGKAELMTRITEGTSVRWIRIKWLPIK